MNADMTLPIITSLAWLILVGSALASHRLGWSKIVKMALIWIAIFFGMFLMVEWFLIARNATSALI